MKCSFPEVLYKGADVKNFSRFTDKHRKQSPVDVLPKDAPQNLSKFNKKCLCWSLLFNKVAGLTPEIARSSHWRCSVKKVFLKRRTGVLKPAIYRSSIQNRSFWIIHKIHRRKPPLKSLFNKVEVLRACNTY